MQQKLILELKLYTEDIVYGENLNNLDLKLYDKVVLYLDNSYDIAEVISEDKIVNISKIYKRIGKIIRKINQQDLQRIKDNEIKSQEIYKSIKKNWRDNEYPIKIVKIFYSFDRSKLFIYYTLEKQFDFKRLIRELAHKFKVRVILKQVGARDETKILGGIGSCGYEICCKRWIKKFESISVEMAKTQQLALNIPKLSGLCNRLKCCLSYEYDFYKQCLEKFPKIGSKIKTKEGEAKVIGIDCIKELITIEYKLDDDIITKTVSIKDISR